jgi:hypothetical protein
MATAALPLIGVGYLVANDLLTDISFRLLETCVNTAFYNNIMAGTQTILAWDNAIYVGAQLLCGTLGVSAEVVTVTAVNPGVSFSAVFQNNHAGGEPIVGATFPVQNTAGDYFFSQNEMLTYLSNSVNDFLTRVPLVINVTDSVVFGPTAGIEPLPSDCMTPMRVATAGVSLRETSQANLDGVDYRWQVQALATPYTYFRDKVGLQNIGIWPRQANTVPLELVYQQRGSQLMGLGDGFLLPDTFLPIIKSRVLSFAYSKDGEQRSPGNAKFFDMRYEAGVKIAKMWLEIIADTSQQMQ